MKNTNNLNQQLKKTIKNKIIIDNDKKKKIKKIKDVYNLSDFPFQKPFLKWVGGKTQIITDILKNFPLVIENYHEIF